jgi:hypothetical protein
LVGCDSGVVPPHHMSTAEAMRKMTEFKDLMCACKDSVCAQRISGSLTRWGQERAKELAEPPKMTEEDARKFTKLGEQMGECMQKALGGSGYPSQTNQGG